MVNKLNKEQQIVYNLFLGAAFTGFAFDNYFILKFNRETPVDISGVSFNGDFKIIISSELRFEDNKEVIKKMLQDRIGSNDELSEPVLSYKLTFLRWSNGADIYDVKFEDDGIKLLFRNGINIYISNFDVDYAWLVCETYKSYQEQLWDIICEDNNIYINRKNFGQGR